MLSSRTSRRLLSALLGLSISSLFGAQAASADEIPDDPAYTTEDVSFSNAGLTLRGTVLVPTDGDAVHPAVVLVAGSGARSRDDYLAEARALAISGVIALVYDKRTVGYSLTERSYALLGDDAIAGLRLLQARGDVDRARAGLWGHSEGGWVVPLAASTHDGIGFVVVAGASAIAPSQVQAWSTCRYLEHAGFPEKLCEPVGVNLTRVMVAAGMFPEAGYDPVPAIEGLRVPTLVLLAEHDQSMAPVSSGALFGRELGDDVVSQICVVPGADHEFRASSDGFTATPAFARGYLELAGKWITAHRDSPFDCPSGEPAQQSGDPEPLQPLGWYEAPPAHAVAIGWMLAALLSYPISGLIRRMRGIRGRPVAAAPARLASAVGIATVLGTLCLLGYLMANGATEPIGAAMLGRPVVWLVLQVLAVVTLVATVWTAVTWRRRRVEVGTGEAIRLGLLLSAGAVLLPWAAWWGLLTV